MVDRVVQVFYILTDFLSTYSSCFLDEPSLFEFTHIISNQTSKNLVKNSGSGTVGLSEK